MHDGAQERHDGEDAVGPAEAGLPEEGGNRVGEREDQRREKRAPEGREPLDRGDEAGTVALPVLHHETA